jgi:hypothetical protein
VLQAPAVPRTTRRGAEVFGINEGVTAPPGAKFFGDQGVTRLLQARAATVADLGATFTRATNHTTPPLNWWANRREHDPWEASDRWFAALGSLEAVVVISPWPSARTALYTPSYVPRDMTGYAAWVQQVVERYDGDGVADMPGLIANVAAWEVDNEPDLHHTVAPRGAASDARPEQFETPSEYARVLVATAAAIRRADPSALVLSAGIYRPMTEEGAGYLRDVLAEPGALDAIDAVSIHCYFAGESLEIPHRAMLAARAAAPALPIWVTETSVPSEGRIKKLTPEYQARMLVALHGALLAEGADRIAWHTLVDAPREEGPGSLSRNALFTTEGLGAALEPKPAALAYRRLAHALAPVSTASLREIAADGGRVLEADRGWLVFEGTVGVPAGAVAVTDLLTGKELALSAPVPAPAWVAK